MDKDTVFVLGAGFTHAFCENAPLLLWDMSSFKKDLLKKYRKFDSICKVLTSIPEIKQDTHKVINVEELLSRLSSPSPYDDVFLKDGERKVLYGDIYEYFFEAIKRIKTSEEKKIKLELFAKFIVDHEITCITFNYDTVLDQALYEYKKVKNILYNEKYWHPDGGYGFFCRPVSTIVDDSHPVIKDPTSMCLLKLHGSLNWKIKRGFQKPYPLDALIHEESWTSSLSPLGITQEDVSIHLESSLFVIPPILDKSALADQPILKVLWGNALKRLLTATKVVFIGYSLPKTDIAATFLFREALRNTKTKNIFVVSDSGNGEEKINAYKTIFPKISKRQFSFVGAVEWIANNCTT